MNEHSTGESTPAPGDASGDASSASQSQALTPRQVEILVAAAEVFGEKGYSSGSMRDIAQRVGVSEPALYRHFPGKRELFVTMVRVLGASARAEGSALIAGATPDNVRTYLNDALKDRRLAFARYAPVIRAMLNAAASEPLVVDEFRRTLILPLTEQLTRKTAELDEAFGVPDAEATRASRVRALLALLAGTMVTSFLLGDEPEQPAAGAVLRIMGWQDDSMAGRGPSR